MKFYEYMNSQEKKFLLRALKKRKRNLTMLCEDIGLGRTQLYRLLKKHKIYATIRESFGLADLRPEGHIVVKRDRIRRNGANRGTT